MAVIALSMVFLCTKIIKEREEDVILTGHNGTLIYGIIVSLIYGLFNAYFLGQYMTMNLIGFLAIPTILLIVVFLLKKLGRDPNKLIGFGDIKYIAMLGLFMGFGLQVFAILFSIVIAVIGVVIKKYKEIPFGYFLSIGSVVALVFSPYLKEITDLMNVTFFIF
jgi:prepilin signal peptidase PulO-like enzyme (type II secretory pathway)